MARTNTQNGTKTNEWVTVREGVAFKRGKENRISINWFGAVIHGVRIMDGPNGKFLSWPAFKGKDGTYINTAYVYAPRGSEDETILAEVLKAAM